VSRQNLDGHGAVEPHIACFRDASGSSGSFTLQRRGTIPLIHPVV
jgi:hypothetical protein